MDDPVGAREHNGKHADSNALRVVRMAVPYSRYGVHATPLYFLEDRHSERDSESLVSVSNGAQI